MVSNDSDRIFLVPWFEQLGLYWLTYGLTYLPGFFTPATGYTPGFYIYMGAAQMILGVFLMFKADGVVETCYSHAALKGQEGAFSQGDPGKTENDE